MSRSLQFSLISGHRAGDWRTGLLTRARLIISIPVLVAVLLGTTLFVGSRLLSRTPKVFAFVDETTLVVLKGDAQVERSGGSRTSHTPASEDTILRAGDRVRTGAAGYAALIYLDGSTTELDPGTSVMLRRAERLPGGAVRISFEQEGGQTWNRVERLKEPTSQFETRAVSTGVNVRGAEYRLVLDEAGRTVVETFTDAVAVEAASATVELPAGYRTTVPPGRQPGAPEAIPPAASGLRIEVQGSARPFLTDGHNRSVGFHPEIDAYGSQVPGATYRVAGNTRTLLIPNPVNPYNLVLSPEGDGGNYTLNITALKDGRAVSGRVVGLARPLLDEMTGTLTRGQHSGTTFNVTDNGVEDLQPLNPVPGAPDNSRVRSTKDQQGNANQIDQSSGQPSPTLRPSATPSTTPTPALQSQGTDTGTPPEPLQETATPSVTASAPQVPPVTATSTLVPSTPTVTATTSGQIGALQLPEAATATATSEPAQPPSPTQLARVQTATNTLAPTASPTAVAAEAVVATATSTSTPIPPLEPIAGATTTRTPTTTMTISLPPSETPTATVTVSTAPGTSTATASPTASVTLSPSPVRPVPRGGGFNTLEELLTVTPLAGLTATAAAAQNTPTATQNIPVTQTPTFTATVTVASSATPTATPSPTPSPTFTVSLTTTPTAAPSGTATATSTSPPSATATATLTPEDTPTATLTATVAATATPTASATSTTPPTGTAPPTPSVTPTHTDTPSPVPSATFTATVTPVPATATFTATVTPVPATATFTATATPLPATATFTATVTPVPATATFTATVTPVPATATFTATATPVPATATFTATATQLPATPTITATPQPIPPSCSNASASAQPSSVPPGGNVEFTATGFQPFSTVNLSLSGPTDQMGTQATVPQQTTADENCTVFAVSTASEEEQPGNYTITASGTSFFGNALQLQANFSVVAPPPPTPTATVQLPPPPPPSPTITPTPPGP